MDQFSLGNPTSNQQSSAEKKKQKLKFMVWVYKSKSQQQFIDHTNGGQKFVNLVQREQNQVPKQISQLSFPQAQLNNNVILEIQLKKQVEQFDQDSGQQQLLSDSSVAQYENFQMKNKPFDRQISGSTFKIPHFSQNDWNIVQISNIFLKLYLYVYENEIWVRWVCHHQNQILYISKTPITFDDFIDLLLMGKQIGIGPRQNKFREKENTILMSGGILQSNFKTIPKYMQFYNVANGLTPEGKSWRDDQSSEAQLGIVGEFQNKDYVEYIMGGQGKERKNVFLQEVRRNEFIARQSILQNENATRSIWLQIKQ